MTTRTVHYKIDPALAAYCAYLDAEHRAFVPREFDLFAAGYRAEHPALVEQPMTSLGYLLTGALTAIIAAVSWGLAIYYAPVVIGWMRS